MTKELSRALILCLALAAFAQASLAGGDDDVPRLQDDFYAAVNAQWLASAEVPADKMMVGGFSDLADEVEAQLMADFAQMTPEQAAEFDMLPEFLKLYAIAADYPARDAQGAEPLQPYLRKIEALDSLSDLNDALADFLLSGMPAPLSLFVRADMGDATRNALYAGPPSLFLPDSTYYGTPTGEALLGYLTPILEQLLQMSGQSPEEAARNAEQALAFDKLLAPHVPSAQESSDYVKLYNPVTLDEFCAAGGALDLRATLTALTPALPEKVVVTSPKFFDAFNQIVCEDTFAAMKSWLLAQMVYAAAPMLSQEMADTAATYSMIMTGQTGQMEPQMRAYRLAASTYDAVVGNYYGRTYFGEEAKADVTKMVKSMVGVFERRLRANDWLSEETVSSALRKLERMNIQIGYPDKVDPLYQSLTITGADQGGTLLGNMMDLTRKYMEDLFAKCGEETEPEYWLIGAATVNAIYSPVTNTITFPAAILQEPFYSLQRTDSRNLGGIGAVIAHEITHAFDSSGAQFDESGSLKNWWTEADYAAFGERTQAAIAQFEGIPFAGGTVNGQLTVGENIADAGGLSCALESCQALPDANLKDFFENWATIWRMKATPQVEQLLLTVDVHAPSKLRANVQLQNQEAFFEAYGIVEGDGMYLAPEKRVRIW